MRRLVLLCSTIVFVDALLFTALTPLVPGYAEAFDLSKAQAGLLSAAFGAGALVGGIPAGLIAVRLGPRGAVLSGLLLLAVASFAFAVADSALELGLARFVQGFSSVVTWAGALAWVVVSTDRERRGERLGTAFGAAILGAILGPMFGGIAETIGISGSFIALGGVALALAAVATTQRAAESEPSQRGGLARALADPRFLGGLWLNTLPALLFGILALLAPLALDEAGWTALAIATLFFAAGSIEVVLNPVLGRFTDRVGRLVPVRAALALAVVVALGLAATDKPAAIAVLACAAALSFGAFYTPGMALASDRAEAAGLAQGMAFGLTNTAWALGNTTGPAVGGAVAEGAGDAAAYLLAAALCASTLAAVVTISHRHRIA